MAVQPRATGTMDELPVKASCARIWSCSRECLRADGQSSQTLVSTQHTQINGEDLKWRRWFSRPQPQSVSPRAIVLQCSAKIIQPVAVGNFAPKTGDSQNHFPIDLYPGFHRVTYLAQRKLAHIATEIYTRRESLPRREPMKLQQVICICTAKLYIFSHAFETV